MDAVFDPMFKSDELYVLEGREIMEIIHASRESVNDGCETARSLAMKFRDFTASMTRSRC